MDCLPNFTTVSVGIALLQLLWPNHTKGCDLQVIKPEKIAHVALRHKKNDFYAETSDVVRKIQRCDVDKEIRGIDTATLGKMLASGHYLTLNKFENTEDYCVRLKGRLKGGGPIFGGMLYAITKGACYGAIALGVKKFTGSDSTGGLFIKVVTDGAKTLVEAGAENDILTKTTGLVVQKAMSPEEAKQLLIAGSTIWGANSIGVIEAASTYAYLAGCAVPWLP